jgi:HPt (histidine-containing phosphotransfer) domain-containing protein
MPNKNDAHYDASACRHAAAASSSEVLDLEGLRNRCMGNLDLVQRVLDKFQQRLPEELAELERMLELNDAEQVARVAHRIRGNSASVSAQGLQQAAAEIEDLSRMGRVTDVPVHVEHLRSEWQRYLEHASTPVSAIDAG